MKPQISAAVVTRAMSAMLAARTTEERARLALRTDEIAVRAGYLAWPDRAVPPLLAQLPQMAASYRFGLECRDEYEREKAGRRLAPLASFDAYANVEHADF
jgi:hypothetical protein